MKTLGFFFLSSFELSPDMKVETGAEFSSSITIGNSSLFVINVKQILSRFANSGLTLKFFVLHPSDCHPRAEDVLFATEQVPGINPKASVEFVPAEYPLSLETAYRSFHQTFALVSSLCIDRGVDGPIYVISGDVVLKSSSLLFRETATYNEGSHSLLMPIRKLPLYHRSNVALTDRWTKLCKDAREGRYSLISNPNTILHERIIPENLCVYLGCCSFASPHYLESFLEDFFEEHPLSIQDSRDAFFERLVNYGEPLREEPSAFYEFGSIDSYWNSKLAFLQSRFFNTLTVDFFTHDITKSSPEDTTSNALLWYAELQEAALNLDDTSSYVKARDVLRNSILPIKSRPLEGDSECVSYSTPVHMLPSLSDCLVQGMQYEFWVNAGYRVGVFLKALGFKQLTGTKRLDSECFDMYQVKTATRLSKALNSNPSLKDIHCNGLYAKDVLTSLSDYLRLSNLLLPSQSGFTLIHGDPCFSNLLFDRRLSSIKAIDPRGKFGSKRGAYGDPAYDFAKVLHSCYGKYDLIMSSSLVLCKNGDDYCLVPAHSVLSSNVNRLPLEEYALFAAETNKRLDLFQRAFFYEYAKDPTRQLIYHRAWNILPLLFLSMIPLHQDDTQKQKALLFRGLELYSTTLERLRFLE